MKKLWLLILLSAIAVFGQQAPPAGYVAPQALAAMGPNGFFASVTVDTSGNLNTTGGSGTLQQIGGFVQPVAPVAQDSTGAWHYLQVDGSGNLKTSGGGGGSPNFGSVTTGTNTTTLTMGSGGVLTFSGSGVVNANQTNGAAIPTSKTIVGTNGSGQLVDASSAALTNNTSGTAANLSGTPALPNGTTATTQAASDNTTKLATDAFAGSIFSANGSNVAFPNLNNTTPIATNGYNNGYPDVSGSSLALELYTNFIDLADGYTSGDPCAYMNTVFGNTSVTNGNYYAAGGFIKFFTDEIVPCQSNPFESLTMSGTIDLGTLHYVKSVPWVTPGGSQRFIIEGSGTADVGTTVPAVNTIVQDCGSEAPGWNGTNCVVHSITVAAYKGSGHSVTTTYPHGMFQPGTYWPSFWLGGMTAGGINLGGNFGQIVRNFTIWPGAGGGNWGLYITGAQEQGYCQNVTVRASNDAAIFLDRVQGNATGPSHFALSGCTGRMDDANTAAQGYPLVGSTAMGYGIVYEGNGDVLYATGGGCTVEPQGYVSAITSGALTTAVLTYGGSGCTSTPSCTVGSNRGSSGTCTWGAESGGSVPSVSVSGGTGYSLGDTLGGGILIEDATINGDNTKNMQNGVVIDGCYSCKISQIHTGFDADYGILIGYGSGAITGGVFENNDLENASNGVYHIMNGIDKNQVFFSTGKGGSVATIKDDACNFTSLTTIAISIYDPCTMYVLAGQAPNFPSGVIFPGSTSGSSQITETATAGTMNIGPSATPVTIDSSANITDPGNITLSNATPSISSSATNANMSLTPNGTGSVLGPAGSTTVPGFGFTGNTTTGISISAANILGLLSNGVEVAHITGGIALGDAASFKFSQTAAAGGAVGAAINIVGSGTTEALSTGGTSTGQWNRPGECKPTTSITITTTATPGTTICSWTLPNSAQTWSWLCQGTYSTTTTSISFTLGMVAAQTPTTETGNGIIYTSNAGAQTSGSATATSTTATTILAGGSVASATTNMPFLSSGTVQASATSGTFILYGLASTASDVTVNVGTTCYLY